MDNQEINDLQRQLDTLSAVNEERWHTLYREQKQNREYNEAAHKEIKDSIEKLNKLVWSVGGSVIFILATAVLATVLK